MKIGLASPEAIREWSYGEVKKPETINYRTLKPERDGLFCERIFGPQKDWECYCGRYKRIRYKGKVCERCGVEVTRAKVRRERMGHIELAAPVSHIWYFKGTSSRMGLLLNMSPRLLEKVLYFAAYIVIDPGRTNLKKYSLLTEKEYRELKEAYEDDFEAGMGAEAVKKLLQQIDITALSAELKEELKTATGQKKIKTLKRLEIVEAFRTSGNKPEWMILDVIPVIPPDIRPMVQLDGGRFATSDLNDLYRRVINRNNRLNKLLDLGAPDIIVRNEKRMLQEAVDALIDNGRRGRPVTGPNNRPLKSLSDMLKGKQGRFRQNLLGKRVDYSGRSVIVVGPELKMYQCGLPKEMAIELFKPFVMKRLVDNKDAQNAKQARKMVERATSKEVWDALEVVIKDHPVLLNRAPTLHRLGIQAFEPVLVEGRALKLHPLVCTAYNADFDGDQMAVHVPLSAEAQSEARFLMLAAGNLLKPSDGRPVAVPTQDMVLGAYYLTKVKEDERGAGKAFRDPNEAIMAYQEGDIGLHAPIRVRMTREVGGEPLTKLVETTAGRIIFNEPIPQDLGFVDRSNPETQFNLEVSFLVRKKELGKIIDRCISRHGTARTAEVLDQIKALGFKFSTRSGITVSISDAVIPEEKKQYLEEAEKQIEEIQRRYDRGLISDEVRYERVIKTWNDTTARVKDALQSSFGPDNPIFMMADSGARGSMDQIRQLAGMRGLIANTSGRAIEIPIRSNYREGLNILEYFNSSRGARKGLADTALRTADSGYLTRRLVDVSQEVIIREIDCGATQGVVVQEILDSGRPIEDFSERLLGRYPVEDVIDPATGEVIVTKDHMMTEQDAERIVAAGYKELEIRSILGCKSVNGVCSKCYGANLANGQPIAIGEAVGVIAAQSIGEPGTQLTMRTFHTGGIASASDITQGLPRVEELFEARKPKNAAIIAHIGGVVSFEQDAKGNDFVVVTDSESGERFEKQIVYGSTLRVAEGDVVKKGAQLTEGAVEPAEYLQVNGEMAVQDYLIQEVQRVYRTQGVDINDKHIEVIVRQMMRKIRVEDQGDTDLIAGSVVSKHEFQAANEKIMQLNQADGGERKLATSTPLLLGITKASLATESFMSAAAFQETTRVLTEAAIQGKVDPLVGLKENVIIGKLIPAGTGTVVYSKYKKANRDIAMPSAFMEVLENAEQMGEQYAQPSGQSTSYPR
ncbi:MAG: DNA-directed RNA polymerase subunit beta' [Oscillospiraceae bacterium]